MRTSKYLRKIFCAIMVLAMLMPANTFLAAQRTPMTDLQLLFIESAVNTTPGTEKIERHENISFDL